MHSWLPKLVQWGQLRPRTVWLWIFCNTALTLEMCVAKLGVECHCFKLRQQPKIAHCRSNYAITRCLGRRHQKTWCVKWALLTQAERNTPTPVWKLWVFLCAQIVSRAQSSVGKHRVAAEPEGRRYVTSTNPFGLTCWRIYPRRE